MTELTNIIDGMVGLIGGVDNVPSLIVGRKEPILQEGEQEGIIISPADSKVLTHAFGASTQWNYGFIVSIYHQVTTDDLDIVAADFDIVKDCKTALDVTEMTGTSVWDNELVQSPAWEGQKFRDGCKLSQFGVLYRTSEAS